MSDGDEVAIGMELAFEEARRLGQKNREHELLDLWLEPEDDSVWEGFQTRFGKSGITREQRQSALGQAYFWGQYFLALRKANEELE